MRQTKRAPRFGERSDPLNIPRAKWFAHGEMDGLREPDRIVRIQRYGRLRLIKGYSNLPPRLLRFTFDL
jgi:hypothetical protein